MIKDTFVFEDTIWGPFILSGSVEYEAKRIKDENCTGWIINVDSDTVKITKCVIDDPSALDKDSIIVWLQEKIKDSLWGQTEEDFVDYDAINDARKERQYE